MKKDKVKIVAILDRSGSMSTLAEDTIGGFNEFVKQQKELDGECSLSLVLFDDRYELVYDDIPINEVPELDDRVYFARGMTALNDAVGKTINIVGQRLNRTPEEEKPEQVIFLITTDGLENQSTEFTAEQIKEMVNHQTEKYSWEFIFMGANIDSFEEGGSRGIAMNLSANYDPSAVGTRSVYFAASSAIMKKRIDKNAVINMTDEYSTAMSEVSE